MANPGRSNFERKEDHPGQMLIHYAPSLCIRPGSTDAPPQSDFSDELAVKDLCKNPPSLRPLDQLNNIGEDDALNEEVGRR